MKIGFTALLVLAVALLAAAGCGGGETTVTVERTVTVTTPAAQAGSSKADKDNYTRAIKDLSTRADQINNDYRTLVDRFNAGQAKPDEMMGKADEDRLAYEDMSAQLTVMKVPPEFQEAHKLMISGYNKWQTAYEAYRDGFRNNDNNLLAKARDYDSQAVIEVNQAINQISQVG